MKAYEIPFLNVSLFDGKLCSKNIEVIFAATASSDEILTFLKKFYINQPVSFKHPENFSPKTATKV